MNLLATGTATSLLAGVGANVQTTFASVQDIVFAVIALYVTFWLVSKIVAMFPKGGTRRA